MSGGGFHPGDIDEGPVPQRVTGKHLDDITPAEAEQAIDLRDVKIAAQVRAEAPKGGVY